MTFRGFAGDISEVSRGEGEVCVEWEIPRFLDLHCGGYDYYDSFSFSFYDARWHLEVFPNHMSFENVNLFFCRSPKFINDWGEDDGEGPCRTVIVSSGMKVSGGGVEWRGEEVETTLQKGVCTVLAWPFCERSELREGDALTILCKIKKPGTTA